MADLSLRSLATVAAMVAKVAVCKNDVQARLNQALESYQRWRTTSSNPRSGQSSANCTQKWQCSTSVLSSMIDSVSVSSYAVASIAACILLMAFFVGFPLTLNWLCSVGDRT